MSQEWWVNVGMGFAPAGKGSAARVGLVEVSKPLLQTCALVGFVVQSSFPWMPGGQSWV